MQNISRLFLILSVLLCGNGYAATLIFNNGFEEGNINLSAWDPHVVGGTFTAVSSPVFSGSYAGKFDLQFVSSSADNYRAETYLANGKGDFQYNTEYWFSFNYRFEDWVKDSSTEFAPFQIHLRPSNWSCQLGTAWSNAPFYMYVSNDTMNLNTWPAIKRWTAPIQKKTWLTITIRFIPSWGSNGVIEAWFNGAKIVSVSGQNHPRADGCGGDHRAPYFNLGIYKWDWRIGRPATQSSRRTLLVDNLKIAQGADGYNTVTGSTPPPENDTTPPVISSVAAAPTSNSATITWNTNEASDTVVEYGLTTTYGGLSSNASLVTSHSRTITGLESTKTYHYRVKSKDASGNTKTDIDRTFTTAASDISEPVISNVSAAKTDTTATITWTTNELAKGSVQYGLTSSYGSTKPESSFVTSHSVTLTGLNQSTDYHYRVSATDNAGNSSNSVDFTFTTNATSATDTTPPDISNVQVSPNESGANITWTTNEPATTTVNYGLTTSYGSVYNNSAKVTAHAVAITGLPPETLHHYMVSSTDASNNTGEGADMTFTTTAVINPVPTVHAPVIRRDPCN